MAQRKKKPSEHQVQAITKAHHKKEFMRKLKYLTNEICGEDFYSLMPQKFLERNYSIRYHPIKIVPSEEISVPNAILDNMRGYLSSTIKYETITLPQRNTKISIDDYFTVGLTLGGIAHVLKSTDFPQADKVKSALHSFSIDEETYQLVHEKLRGFLHFLGYWHSLIGSRLYWLKFKDDGNIIGKPGSYNLVEIFIHEPESIRIKINDAFRPVVRLSWAFAGTGVVKMSLSSSVLNTNGSFPEKLMKVYVQNHALLRLAERIDCIPPFMLHLNMYETFLHPKISYDNNNNMLIEYRIFGAKAGYFRIDIIDDIIVVITFLFLTQKGTPEGKLLWQNTGLQKLDTKYLAIDKLSSFMSSDIGDNEQIRKIFENSGCQSLLEFHGNIDKVCLKHPSQSTSKLMLEYLQYQSELIPESAFE